MKIANQNIGINEPPFIIAEMSGNHNQSLDRALKMVSEVASSGANAIKLQTFTADTITLDVKDGDFLIKDEGSPWNGSNLYDLYKLAHTPWEWHAPIMERAQELGLICFSTPFDESAVDFLETLDVPAYKIASFENIHLPLIRKVASTGKPLFLSTGMASLAELDEAVDVIHEAGCNDLVMLKCTSMYPANPIDSNVLTIPNMKDLFNCQVGLSDHTLGIGVATAAVAHGATVIEKHFTLSRKDGGVDSTFSLEPSELNSLVIETKRAWQSLGKISYGANNAEKNSKIFRRSIYISEDTKKGDVLTAKNLRCVRPGMGLSPKYFDILIGKRVNQDIKKGTPMSWSLLE